MKTGLAVLVMAVGFAAGCYTSQVKWSPETEDDDAASARVERKKARKDAERREAEARKAAEEKRKAEEARLAAKRSESQDGDEDEEDTPRRTAPKAEAKPAPAPVKPVPFAKPAPRKKVRGEEEEEEEDDERPRAKRVASASWNSSARSDAATRPSAAPADSKPARAAAATTASKPVEKSTEPVAPKKKPVDDIAPPVEPEKPAPKAATAAAPAAAVTKPAEPPVKTECATILVALREPQQKKGAWGSTEVVTVVELAKGLDCGDARRGGPDPKVKAATALLGASLPMKEGKVVKVTEAADWTLGQDETGKTWRSRTITAVVEKPVAK